MAVALTIGGLLPALADDTALAVQTLPTVSVIATTPLPGAPVPIETLPFMIQRAGDRDISASGAGNLGDFLNRHFDGVYVNEMQGNPFQPDVSYRGYTASPLLGTPQGLSLYLDGVRLNQPFGDVVSWDLIPKSAIARVTLASGSNPLFGLNTLGGAIVVQTKDGIEYPGTSVSTLLGSYGRRQVEFESGGSNAHGLSWFTTGTAYHENGWRDASPSRVDQLFGKLGWRSASTTAFLTASTASTNLYGNGLQDGLLLDARRASVYTIPDVTRNNAGLLAFNVTHRLSDALSASGVAYLRRVSTQTLNGDINDDSLGQDVYSLSDADRATLVSAGIAPPTTVDPASTPFPSFQCIAQALQHAQPDLACNGLLNRGSESQTDAGLSGQLAADLRAGGFAHRIVVGAALSGSRTHFVQGTQLGYLNPDRSVTPVDAFADGVTGGTDDDGDPLDNRVDLAARTTTWSVFASDTVALAPRLFLTGSARYNHTQVRNHDRLHDASDPSSLDADDVFARLDPALGLAWNPSPLAEFYAGYNEGSRTPTAIELGCASAEVSCRLPNALAGDPPLRQVVTHSIEAGWRGHLGPRTRWHAGVFRADNIDDILFVTADVSGTGHFQNVGKTRRQGIELGAETGSGPLTVSMSWTLLDARFRSPLTLQGAGNSSNDAGPGLDGNIEVMPGDRLPLVPRQIAKVSAHLALAAKASLDLDMIATAGAPARGNENGQDEPDGTYYIGPGRSSGYAVFNLGATFAPAPRVTLRLRIDNLLDRRYATAAQLGATGFSADGRFVSQPFPANGDGDYPMRSSTFFAPGAPRQFSVEVRYRFD